MKPKLKLISKPDFEIPYLWLLALPFALTLFGWGLNILAISANHGMMPFVVTTAERMAMDVSGFTGVVTDQAHKIMESSDHLKFLCDWIQLPHEGTCSIGDLFLLAGDAIRNYILGAWLALVARDFATKA